MLTVSSQEVVFVESFPSNRHRLPDRRSTQKAASQFIRDAPEQGFTRFMTTGAHKYRLFILNILL